MTSLLQAFTNIRRKELLPTIVAGLFFFCILTALMVVRPAREALGMQRGIDAIRWLFMATLLTTLLVNPLFGLLVSRFRRMTFIAATYSFFSLGLVGFYALLTFAPTHIGIISGQVFYVWFSVFNLFATMLFWALMTDRFSKEQSERLFAAISLGGTLGAMFGPWLAGMLARPYGTPVLLLVAAVFLIGAIGAAWWLVHLHTDETRLATNTTNEDNQDPDRTIIGGSAWEGLTAVVRSPFLLGISAYVLILAVVATLLYFTRLQMVAALALDTDTRTEAFARIDLYTQAATFVLQAFLTSHLIKRFGIAVTLALLPLTVAFGFIGLAVIGSLGALIAFEASFRAVQRGVMRPARETLFTTVPRAERYKAKAFIDTFVYRGGDAIGSQTEGLLGRLGMGLAGLAWFAVPLAVIWMSLGLWLGYVQNKRNHSDVNNPT
ncbi:MFS transporter [Zwartia sp.]|uniref:NTP/NDP exchange transporter n=1 Tax=Zwartia sp. TaxID=2978004 RepID=UPI00271810AA|nr:MFS transporter [Zwartia sp.]MDO9023458.1 MFS transporter [Zwartia sp.]